MLNPERITVRKFDSMLFFSVISILFIGLAILYSASSKYHAQNIVFRQSVWIAVGVLVMAVIVHIAYQRIVSVAYILYAVSILFLIAVLFIGEARGGARRWIGLGPFNFQPSELTKITLILALASYMGRRKAEATKITFILGAFLIMGPAFALILIEPDLGTALLLIPITMMMLFIAGARVGYLLGIVGLGIGALPVFWHFLHDYQKQRLFVFINPNIDPLGSGYTIVQSKIAIGSGGLWGKGWLSGTQNQLNFLPERHTDFIFSVVGEEWGLLGALFLILLYAVIVYRTIKIIEGTSDMCGKLVAAGLITLFSLQVIINIGMTIGFLPIVGLTLPLVSYGGSSLITTLLYLGILLNIGMRRTLF
jgi:rod shape determining protein RodA